MRGRTLIVSGAVVWSGIAAAAPISPSFIGTWVVSDVVGYSNVSDGVPGAKRILGKSITITKDAIYFMGEKCRPPEGFSNTTVETAPKLLDYYQVALEDTGLPAKTQLLDSSQCAPVFLMDAHRILFGWGGVIVRAIKP